MTKAVLATRDEAMTRVFVREYFDNGLDVYDTQRTPLGTVCDYDRPGGGFVITLSRESTCLFIPFRLITKVKHGRVYLCLKAKDLTSRLP